MAGFPIVGIGSSAGGLEALRKLLTAMPSDSGLGFVVAAHLDPTQESHLASLLARCTQMPVIEIKDMVRVEPNHVYVIAPDQELGIKEGVLHPSKPRAPRGHRHPVDGFFRSLAEDQGERAIAIVLSGTGTNGSLGLRFIKAEGGIAIAQNPETAGFQGMPRSAIGTGVVDLVLPPEKIPESLVGLARHVAAVPPAKEVEAAAPENTLGQLLKILEAKGGRDFGGYKRGTLLRRIYRRMSLHRIDGLEQYITRLRNDASEVKALASDLTINVTGFFRDPEAWDVLSTKVVAPLVKERPSQSAIRIWVPGCSTGEEAYSIAILFTEQADLARKSFDLRLFATDVAESVLASARSGQYPGSIAIDVGEKRLQRFFDQHDDTFYIKKSIRDSITFAPQNILQDPPFSRVDLISCRNLLIYLQPDVQRRVLGLFHFALHEGGHMFLGSAETASAQEDLFQAVSKKWRIFRRVGPTRHDVVDFSLLGGGALLTGDDPRARAGSYEYRTQAPGDVMMQALVDRYAPASVMIDADHRVHFFRGATGDFLQPASGEPSHNLLAMAKEGLHMPLRTAIRKAIEENKEVVAPARVRRDGRLHPVRLIVSPVRSRESTGRLLVCFLDGELKPGEDAMLSSQDLAGEQQLQSELDTAREDLRLTVEQMDAANEELKASNEEIRSINEELQASNEELETSKEELQSLNEELNTVNSQLQSKVTELEQRTNELNNLLNSTDIATLFLDRSLCIRWFTPAMKALFDLMPSDIGRPISHFAQRFTGDELTDDANKVLKKLMPMDTEVLSDDGRWYIRHISPYRTDEDQIGGVVVCFSDITMRKQMEQRLRDAKEFAESIVDTVRDPLLVLKADLRVQSANLPFYEKFRVKPKDTEGRSIFELGNGQWNIPELRHLIEDILPEDRQFSHFEVERQFETIGCRTMLLNGRRLDNIPLILLTIEDITERKSSEMALRRSEERLRKVLETEAIGVLFLNPDGIIIDANDLALQMTGYTRDEIDAHQLSWRMLTPPEWLAITVRNWNELRESGRIGPYEKEYLHRDGSRSWMLFAGASLEDGTVVKFCLDISDRKRAEAERELLARELSHRVKNTLAVVQALASQTDGHARSLDAYKAAFIGRLQAMARAHNLLLETNWKYASLKMLAEAAVAAYRIDHPEVVEIEGSAIDVNPKQGLGLSLILHELSTNAAKYGALSRQEGRLRISWGVETVDKARRVRLQWQERNGPQIDAPPTEAGFGTRLIKQAGAYELGGKVELDFAPEGLTCTMVFSVEQ